DAGNADRAFGPRVERPPPGRDSCGSRRRSRGLVSDVDAVALAGLAGGRRFLAGSSRMNQCTPFGADGPAGVADALQKVDCLASDATAMSFGRLFGAHGSFQTALTIILTLYVAMLAFNLLTGRSALRVSVLTPRMMTLGLVLTFATSWVAYQSVV